MIVVLRQKVNVKADLYRKHSITLVACCRK